MMHSVLAHIKVAGRGYGHIIEQIEFGQRFEEASESQAPFI